METSQGQLGAVGFILSGGLATAIDLTLDPDRLQSLDRGEDAPGPDPQGAAIEPGLLGFLRGRAGSVAERIITEALSWPGVYHVQGEFGSVVLRLGRRELGHLHGDAMAAVPIPPKLRDQLINDRVALEREPGWVSVPLETEEGVQQALALLRGNYERGDR
jgi:Family of unknown function (DUF5519)